MTTRLEIEFFNPLDPSSSKDSYALSWRLLENEGSFVWLKLLYQSLKEDLPIFARFTGFDNSPKDLAYLSRKMNEAIEIINFEGHYPEIKERADGTFSQEFANVMHHHFELLHGDAKNPSPYYKKSSPMGRCAIALINYCVHDMEALSRVVDYPESARAVIFEVINVKSRKQYHLPASMEKDFSLDISFGDICLHYGLVGKTWWEVFLDEDEEIFEEGIRPLDVIGPEFDIHFLPQKLSPKIVKKFYSFLKKQGLDPKDPSLRLGFYRIAELETDSSKENILKEVGRRSGIKSIRLIRNEKLWIEREMVNRPSCQEGFWRLVPLQVISNDWQAEINRYSNEVFVVSGAEDKTTLNKVLTRGELEPTGHSVSLVVSKEGHSIKLIPSDQERGIAFDKEIIVRPGEAIHFHYNEKDKLYYPEVKTQ